MHRGTFVTLFACAFILTLTACGGRKGVSIRANNEMPRQMLWAWERPEDLTFLNPEKYGVAFLAQTIFLEKDRTVPKARRQPLDVGPDAYIVAVTRIETAKGSFERPIFSDEMSARVVSLVATTLELPNVKAIQIDFDATVSERNFYRKMMVTLRETLPPGTPLSMTSLASWCVGDAWFGDFPIDEAVPMAFQMGADSDNIKNFLRRGNDWREPLCRGSYGISLDEPPLEGLNPGRRTFYFSNEAWRPLSVPKR